MQKPIGITALKADIQHLQENAFKLNTEQKLKLKSIADKVNQKQYNNFVSDFCYVKSLLQEIKTLR